MPTIRGLTIELGATTTKLGTELKKIKDQSSEISGELRTVDKLLKFESGDKTELLKRRLEAVEKAASEVKKEMDLYTKGLDANKKAVDAGEISQEQYEKNIESLNKQLNTAKNRYEVLQAELGDTARKLDESKQGTADNAEALQNMGDAADDAGKKSLSLGDLIKGNLISGAILGGLKSVVGLMQNLASAAWNAVKKTAEAVITYGKEAIDLAASFQDSLGYSDQIFGDWYEDVTKFVDDNTLALRSNKAELLENVNTFGALFRASGMGRDKAYEYSTSLIKLASDMRAATGIPLDQVIQNLQSVMTGGAEAGYKYGLVIKDTQVKMKALQMGLVGTEVDMTDLNAANLKLESSQIKLTEALWKYGEGSLEYREAQQKVTEAEEAANLALEGKAIALTEAQMQEARYALIMEQSATMQGQATRESGNYKSQLDLMRTTLDNLKIDIGEKLLPVVNEIISEANAFFQSEEGKQLLEDLTTGIGNVATSILNFLQSDDFKKFKDEWIPKIETFISNLITNLPGIAQTIAEKTPGIVADLGSIFTVLGNIIQAAKDVLDWLKADDEYIKNHQSYADKINRQKNSGQENNYQGRASGGPVIANSLYRVGENGPELFVPRVNGTILNAQQTQALTTQPQRQAAPTQTEQIINLTVPQTVYLDGEVIYKNQLKIQRRKGSSLIAGGVA